MPEIIKEFFPVGPELCLHDAVIERIFENDHATTLIVRCQENIRSETANNGQTTSQQLAVRLEGCGAGELSGYLVHRYAIFHHAFRVSKGIECKTLQRMLQKGHTFELIDECYSDNQLYWRLAVKPCKRRGLSDEVELSASGVRSIRYEWMDDCRKTDRHAMPGVFYETDYEIAAACDECGDFPLKCAAMLFDLLEIKGNVIIKNQHVKRPEKEEALAPYVKNKENRYFASPKHPESDYCIWIKQPFSANQTLMPILSLQGIDLSYIVPMDSFDWNGFLENWKQDERELLLSGQAAFICNIIDADRTLNLGFNPAFFSEEKITDVLCQWEQLIVRAAHGTQVKRDEGQRRSEYGRKTLVELSIL